MPSIVKMRKKHRCRYDITMDIIADLRRYAGEDERCIYDAEKFLNRVKGDVEILIGLEREANLDS